MPPKTKPEPKTKDGSSSQSSSKDIKLVSSDIPAGQEEELGPVEVEEETTKVVSEEDNKADDSNGSEGDIQGVHTPESSLRVTKEIDAELDDLYSGEAAYAKTSVVVDKLDLFNQLLTKTQQTDFANLSKEAEQELIKEAAGLTYKIETKPVILEESNWIQSGSKITGTVVTPKSSKKKEKAPAKEVPPQSIPPSSSDVEQAQRVTDTFNVPIEAVQMSSDDMNKTSQEAIRLRTQLSVLHAKYKTEGYLNSSRMREAIVDLTSHSFFLADVVERQQRQINELASRNTALNMMLNSRLSASATQMNLEMMRQAPAATTSRPVPAGVILTPAQSTPALNITTSDEKKKSRMKRFLKS